MRGELVIVRSSQFASRGSHPAVRIPHFASRSCAGPEHSCLPPGFQKSSAITQVRLPPRSYCPGILTRLRRASETGRDCSRLFLSTCKPPRTVPVPQRKARSGLGAFLSQSNPSKTAQDYSRPIPMVKNRHFRGSARSKRHCGVTLPPSPNPQPSTLNSL